MSRPSVSTSILVNRPSKPTHKPVKRLPSVKATQASKPVKPASQSIKPSGDNISDNIRIAYYKAIVESLQENKDRVDSKIDARIIKLINGDSVILDLIENKRQLESKLQSAKTAIRVLK